MAKLTTTQRNALPNADFALPGQRAYPINDKAHARNALARVAQHGSPAQQATVKAKVRRKFPTIGHPGDADPLPVEHTSKHH